MSSRTRRGLAVLASAASLAAGVIGATAPGAQAADGTEPVGGRIALYGGSGVVTVNPDGTGLQSVPGITNTAGLTPNWSPDGSRVVVGSPGELNTGRVTGTTSRITLPGPDGDVSGGSWDSAVYWADGSAIVSSTGSELFHGPSDGSYGSEPLLPESLRPSGSCDGQPTTAPDGTVAFVRVDPCGSPAGPDVWAFDPDTRTIKKIVSGASYPAYSADGASLAFTKVVDGRRQIFTAAADGTGATQVTTDAVDHKDLSWDPAGGRIAYDAVDPVSGAVTAKVLTLSDGSVTTLSTTASKPAWQPLRHDTLVRVYGTGDIGIDDAASRWTFDTLGAAHIPGLLPAKSAVLVNKGNATYATPAVSLASEKQGPVLLTSGNALDAAAVTELKRSLPKGSTVYLVGGTNLLGTGVESQVQALGYKPLRLGGTDLASVSARVAKQIAATPSWIFVADGNDYHDPISASSAAGALGYRGTGVVLLTRGTTVPSSVQSYLNGLDPAKTNLVSVGTNSRKALENTTLNKPWSFWDVSGADTEATAVNLARFWWTAPNVTTVENTWSWQNAVAGNAATATYGPVLWSTIARLSPGTADYLTGESASVRMVQTFGGNDSYAPAMRTDIGTAIAASSDWMSTHWYAGGTPPVPASASKAGLSARALTEEGATAAGPRAEVTPGAAGTLRPAEVPSLRSSFTRRTTS
ncbi:cell wall-binding repeat-containing protein [Streptomyces sp. NPDC026672]|uniref:cell wall-binding repeat-containing protein n=1 Tax=unclassified Streptomyces TaxID=2593676 RepID=UPI0033E945B3